jgi:3-methylcrotonyl-CoA carboxylase alpha subunit
MSPPGRSREWVAMVGGRERSVRLEPDGEELRVRVDGEEFHIGCEATDAGELFLLLNGRPQVVNIRDEGDGNYRIMLGGIERSVRLRDPMSSRIGGTSSPILQDREIEVRSPMHGTVVAVQVAEGDVVDEESPLVVLEAMKMQNALTSPARGRVRQVLVSAGQTVEGEGLLIVMERLAPDEHDGIGGVSR